MPRPRAAERRFRQSPPSKELVHGLEFNKAHIVSNEKKMSSKVGTRFLFLFFGQSPQRTTHGSGTSGRAAKPFVRWQIVVSLQFPPAPP